MDAFDGVPEQGYFAIYDGHGGRPAVDFVAKTLHTVNATYHQMKAVTSFLYNPEFFGAVQ